LTRADSESFVPPLPSPDGQQGAYNGTPGNGGGGAVRFLAATNRGRWNRSGGPGGGSNGGPATPQTKRTRRKMEDFRRVTIEEAIELQATTNPLIHWRPKPNLPEPEQ
jgi:hypothetical protein